MKPFPCRTRKLWIVQPATSIRKRQAAFTLVEALIVLGIIALLVAIVVPVFNSARSRGRTATCASNLRQIAIALEFYADDHRNLYPSSAYAPTNCTWADLVYPYLKTPGVFNCPEYSKAPYRPGRPPDELIDGVTQFFDGSYKLNSFEIANVIAFHRSRWKQPSETIFALEGDGGIAGIGGAPQADEATIRAMGVQIRHGDGLNILFGDGHVKRLSMQALTKRGLWTLDGLD